MNIGNAKERVLVISDLQIPSQHIDTFEFLRYMKRKIKPTRVVQIGDMVDFHCFSTFAKDPDLPGASGELAESREVLKKLYKMFPKLDFVKGNHSQRLSRTAYNAGLPKECIVGLDKILGFPSGWNIHEYRVVIDGVYYVHGHQITGGGSPKAALTKAHRSIVFGHHCQNIGIHYASTEDNLFFGMNIGCLVDQNHKAMMYARHLIDRPILGVGVVDKGVPQYYPMLLDKSGRWTGGII